MTFLDKLVPVVVILVFFYTYYAYVVELCIIKINDLLRKILYLVGINLCSIPVAVHYFATLFIRSGEVPSSFRFGRAELEALERLDPNDSGVDEVLERFCHYRGIQTYTRKYNRIRYCMTCKHIKPDRTHHCSTCKRCVLKMDHHCPWIDNCVHFYNYKIFFLLLIHTLIYCLFYVGTCIEFIIEFLHFRAIIFRDLVYISGALLSLFAGGAVVALLGYHIALMVQNQTTLEAMAPPTFVDNCTFDLGMCDNFFEVFGYNCCLWWLPVPSPLGNGVHFPIRYYQT